MSRWRRGPMRTVLFFGLLLPGFSVTEASAGAQPACGGQPATIAGTPGDDVITGTSGNDVIAARGGTDVVRAGDGNDLVCAGTGDDTLRGEDGFDQMWASSDENDAGSLRGGTGNDLLRTAMSQARAYGGTGADTIDTREPGSSCTAHVVFGRGGADDLIGDSCSDRFHGGRGNDRIHGGREGRQGPRVIGDQLYGGGGNDNVFGESGNDFLYGGRGYDELSGGRGRDECHSGEVVSSCTAVATARPPPG